MEHAIGYIILGVRGQVFLFLESSMTTDCDYEIGDDLETTLLRLWLIEESVGRCNSICSNNFKAIWIQNWLVSIEKLSRSTTYICRGPV